MHNKIGRPQSKKDILKKYMKTIKIFLASSGELSEERKEVALFISSENRKLVEKGIFLELVVWEELLHSFRGERIQDYFNKEILKCDIVLALFFKKVGRFTKEEFELAHKKLKEGKKPKYLYVYFKNSNISTEEITRDYVKIIELKENIQKYEQYYGSYNSIDDLKLQLKSQLDQIISGFQKKKRPAAKSNKVRNISKTIPIIPEDYKNWIIDHCSYMGIDRLREKGNVIQVRLPEIFIPLYAYAPKLETSNAGPASHVLSAQAGRAGHEFGIKESPEDIEELIGENEYLLIEGGPGCGKTTLLKHLSYSLVQKTDVKGLRGFLPVLIFIKDLKGFFESNKKPKPKASTAEGFMSYYFKDTENGLDIETIRAFCRAKKAVFLLDGLDEIMPEYRDIIVGSLWDFRRKNSGIKLVLSGRPHCIEGATVDRLGDRHIKIHALNMEQVQDFIRRWYRYIYHQGSKIGEKTAIDMIGEVKAHPGISNLIDNPLMLTAICILYYDGREIPGQRAELYKKFIDNLLYKRFDGPEKVYEYLKALAFRMHSEGVGGVDRSFAIKVLKSIYEKGDEEDVKEYGKRMEDLFDSIEPNCGLLRFDDGQYSFRHLTFQEFLAAVYMVDEDIERNEIVGRYWNDERYREVIELYAGYLSLYNKGSANRIIENVINKKDKPPFKRWFLASNALQDIHKDRRQTGTLKKVKDRMLEIVSEDYKPEILAEAGKILGWLGDPRDHKEFVKVTGGKYKLDRGIVDIRPVEIGKYPVTNSWYAEFIRDGGYGNEGYWSGEGLKWLAYTKTDQPGYWDDRKWKCPNSPVVGVSWYEAYAFARWLTDTMEDGHEYCLPNEDEWEAAASGIDGRKYPWGNEWDKDKCNSKETGLNKTTPVGIFKNGDTPDGISDLGGNVWEWTLSDYHSMECMNDFVFDREMQKLYDEEKYDEYVSKLKEKNRELPVLHGGSWLDYGDYCRCAYRYRDDPGYRFNGVGFRCARTLTL